MYAAARRQLLLRPANATTFSRFFHTTPRVLVKAGDSVPSVEVQEGSPGNKVDLSKETAKGKFVIVGVPGAFSPACSASHAPGFIKNFDKLAQKGVDGVFIVAVNDPFVTKAWAEALNNTIDKVSSYMFYIIIIILSYLLSISFFVFY